MSDVDTALHESNAAAHEVVRKLRLVRQIDAELDEIIRRGTTESAHAYSRRLGFAALALDRAVENYEEVERRAMRRDTA